ncbi:MAG: AI-2E family transporter [Clostridiales bacterium]|nr:AI-2E family transporter [Clostridiales bacterium]
METDSNNNYEEERRKLNEKHGLTQMPADTKGRIITFIVLAVVLITIWFMLDIAIVTFVLTFVFYHLHKYVVRGLAKTPIKIPSGIVLLIIYVLVLGLIVIIAVNYTPMIMRQISDIGGSLSKFDFQALVADIDPNLKWLAGQIDVNYYIDLIVDAITRGLTSLGSGALNFFLSLLLSFLFILEKKKIFAIGDSMKSSRIAVIYRYFLLFGTSFCYTFGKVMKVQVVIAAINCAVSMTYLSITGFPYILALGIMIFILGLIPVAGVFISLIPLTIIAFNVGGVLKIVEVLIMIAVIHCIEAYFLNPKLMSRRTSLPVSVVFVVLIISQKYLGAWGMLIGVPVFIYIMNVLSIDYRTAMEAESAAKACRAKGEDGGEDGDGGGGEDGAGAGWAWRLKAGLRKLLRKLPRKKQE